MWRRGLFVIPLVLLTDFAHAQLDGARVNWPLPINTNIVTATIVDGTANASLSVFDRVQADVDIDSELYVLSYLRSQAILGRTVHWQALLPAGSQSTNSPLPLSTNRTYADGLGDISIGGTINLIGAAELPVREALRYEVDLNVSLGVLVTFPTGSYDSDEVLNMGSNRWSARVSLPMIKSLTDWVPARRTTLEVTPAVIFFGDNDNSLGSTIKQDPVYSVEAHLTRDMTSKAYISLDYTWIDGGDQALTDNTTGLAAEATSGLGAQLAGVTLGFKINDNLNLNLTHMQTIGENSDPFELNGSLTKIMLNWGWHDVLEPRRRSQGD